eukprot:TRINITY_DN2146_c1_g1_i1.p1 TRINITY_DN2146_c1_g1~~TRINITY_DN2146_c1_g1_i1.p1  ORF type:complete len:375 (-),score=43.11 TRINITY_DN2146_c1_g1_i1:302-1426(-)
MSDNSVQGVNLQKYDLHNSPFIDLESPVTFFEVIKILTSAPWIFVKCLVCGSTLLFMTFCSVVATFGLPIDQPLPSWRRRVAEFGAKFANVINWMLGYWGFKVTGWKNYQKAMQMKNCIGVFNHVSFIDSIIILGLFAPSGVSKMGNTKIPLVGWIIRAFQNIYVPDSNLIQKSSLQQFQTNGNKNGDYKKESSKPVRSPTVEAIKAHVLNDKLPLLLMAPEGTTSSGKQLLQFRKGAFVIGAPVLPVCLKYNVNNVNPGWTITNVPLQAIRLMAQPWNNVEVKILSPCIPTEEELEDPGKFAARVRQKMSDAMQLPLVEQSQLEYRLLYDAGIRTNLAGTKILLNDKVYNERYIDLQPQMQLFQNKRENGKQK